MQEHRGMAALCFGEDEEGHIVTDGVELQQVATELQGSVVVAMMFFAHIAPATENVLAHVVYRVE